MGHYVSVSFIRSLFVHPFYFHFCKHMDVSENSGTPQTPKMIIFRRKTHGCWVPPFKETPTRAINHWCIRITCLRSCMSYQVDNRRRRVDEEFKKAMTESDAPSRNAMLEGNHKIFSNYALCKSNNYYQTCLCKNTLPLMGFPSPNLKMLNQNLHSFFIGCPSVKSSQMAKNRLGFASPSLGTLQFG